MLTALEKRGVLAGVALGPDYPELSDCFLVAATECNPPNELERYAADLADLAAAGRSAAVTAGGSDG